MDEVLPKVESKMLKVISNVILRFWVGACADITAVMIQALLDVCLNFSRDLQQRFRLVVDKQNSALRQYSR